MTNVDFHCHSTASDGGLSPEAVAERAVEAGLTHWSLTDHDTLAGYDSLTQREWPFELIVGVEISTQLDGFPLHMVALNVVRDNDRLNALLEGQNLRRKERAVLIAKKLEQVGFEGVADFIQSLGDRPVSRPDVAKFLVETGQIKSVKKAFDKYLGRGKAGDIKQEWPELSEVIPCVHQAGGVCVLAHPDTYKVSRAKLKSMLQAFADLGGDGVELPHEPATGNFYKYVAQMAREMSLCVSLGSDYHSDAQAWRKIGKVPALAPDLNPIWSTFSA